MTDPLYPRHANSGPAPEVTPPALRVLVADWVDGERIPGSERFMYLLEEAPRFSAVMKFVEPEPGWWPWGAV